MSVYAMVEKRLLSALVIKNQNFLSLYHQYIKTGWEKHYFDFDFLKEAYKKLKQTPDLNAIINYDRLFFAELNDVVGFLVSILKVIESDTQNVLQSTLLLDSTTKGHHTNASRSIEIAIRKIYTKCIECAKFHKLNKFVITKIGKKFEKILSSHPDPTTQKPRVWLNLPSHSCFEEQFLPLEQKIEQSKNTIIDVYQNNFRKTFPELAIGELDYVKNAENEFKRTRTWFGFKMGMTFCVFCWLLIDALSEASDIDFWNQPGLFVYTSIGNLLVFRLMWCMNIYVWSKYDINFISILGLSNLKRNLLMMANETASHLFLFSVNLLIFYRSNKADSVLKHGSFLSYGCPLLLIIFTLSWEIYKYNTTDNKFVSRGLFSKEVVLNSLKAPFAVLTFRDIYASDVMTSFTKVISDSLYSSCWVLSGACLTSHQNNEGQIISSRTDFGSDYMHCTNHNMSIVVGLAMCAPFWIRFLQCCRQFADTNYTQTYPFLYNALKYALAMSVVLYGLSPSGNVFSAQYLVLIVITTLYKAWWDVVMDWGLFDVKPSCIRRNSKNNNINDNDNDGTNNPLNINNNTNNNEATQPTDSHQQITIDDNLKYTPHRVYPGLRTILMFPHPTVYYICAILDLILRFLWVTSLVPVGVFASFVGPQLSFFLGSMEIIRRAMWGCFRLEYEHLKLVSKNAPGYLEFRGGGLVGGGGSRDSGKVSKKSSVLNGNKEEEEGRTRSWSSAARHLSLRALHRPSTIITPINVTNSSNPTMCEDHSSPSVVSSLEMRESKIFTSNDGKNELEQISLENQLNDDDKDSDGGDGEAGDCGSVSSCSSAENNSEV